MGAICIISHPVICEDEEIGQEETLVESDIEEITQEDQDAEIEELSENDQDLFDEEEEDEEEEEQEFIMHKGILNFI